ncbi:MAG TPA: DUF502 domain-containing protein [Methylophilaceae bacterium]|nr:DUF502 domain-containing protein [Methylophilaceae bacterium]
MKQLYQYFFRGLLTALPIGLTIYVLYAFWSWSEKVSESWIRPLVGEAYIPGMGLLITVASILVLGYLISHRMILRLISMIEFPFTNLPVVKSIYLSLKNFADYFNTTEESSGQQAVILKSPNFDLEMVGLITQQSVESLPSGFSEDDRVAVFLPMGYNVGGYTMFVPRDWIRPINMTAEEVMRNSLFAWMTNTKENS